MTEEELVAFLRDNLSLVSENQPPSYGSAGSTEVQLKLGDKVISTIWIDGCDCS